VALGTVGVGFDGRSGAGPEDICPGTRDLYLEAMKSAPRYFWTLVLVGLAAALLAGFSLLQLRAAPAYYGTPLDDPPLVAPFELTDAEGERVTLEKWRGELLLVFFGFTRCTDVCPLTLGRLAKVYDDLGRPEDVQVVMITVDPARDTPELTQRYAGSFDPAFVGLGGSGADIARAAQTFFVGYRELKDKDFLHTDSVALLDREGKMRLIYGQDKVAGLTEDLSRILKARNF